MKINWWPSWDFGVETNFLWYQLEINPYFTLFFGRTWNSCSRLTIDLFSILFFIIRGAFDTLFYINFQLSLENSICRSIFDSFFKRMNFNKFKDLKLWKMHSFPMFSLHWKKKQINQWVPSLGCDPFMCVSSGFRKTSNMRKTATYKNDRKYCW